MLAGALKVNQSLKSLSFNDSGISDRGVGMLADALKVNQSLKSLRLSNIKISCAGASALAGALQMQPFLKELKLHSTGMSDTGACVLAEALQYNHSLEQLDICDSSISDEGALVFVKFLEVNTSLKSLSCSQIKGECVEVLSAMLQMNHLMQKNPLQQQLILTGGKSHSKLVMSAVTKMEQLSSSLTTLDLRSNCISDVEACVISEILLTSKSLQVLV